MSHGRICGDQLHTEVAELPNAMCEEPRRRTAGIGLQGTLVLPPDAAAFASLSASSLSLSPCGHHSKSTTPSIFMLFFP